MLHSGSSPRHRSHRSRSVHSPLSFLSLFCSLIVLCPLRKNPPSLPKSLERRWECPVLLVDDEADQAPVAPKRNPASANTSSWRSYTPMSVRPLISTYCP